LWLFQSHNVVNGDLLKQVLRSPDFQARAAATRVLVAWRDRVPEVLDLLQVQVNDEHPRVRLMAIWGLSYFHGEDAARAAEIVVEALIHPDDPYIQHALSETNKTLDRRMPARESAMGPLLKLLRSRRLPPERQPAIVNTICSRGSAQDLKVVLDMTLDPAALSVAARHQALAGLTDAAATRKVRPHGDLQGLTRLIDDPDATVRLAAVRLAAAFEVTGALAALQKIALAEASTIELRRAAIASLAALGEDGSRQTLIELARKGTTAALRMQAAASLVGFDLKLAAAQAADVLSEALPQDDPAPLLEAFFNRKHGSEELAEALKTKTLSVDVAKRALRAMYAAGRSDAALSAVLSDAAGIGPDIPPPSQEEVAELVRDVMAKGDPARGERIFRRADLSCLKCHSISRAGGQVGPELSAVGGSSPLDYIANSILNPNLAVKEQYVTRVFELTDGKVLTGVVIDRDENRVRIRDAQGNVIVIPTADVEEEAEGKSMMPLGLTKFLTRDELLDLIRFISELGKPGDYAVQSAPRIQRWQVLSNPPAELIAQTPHLDHIRQLLLEGSTGAWTSVYARVNGTFPLEELRQGNQPMVVFLRGEFDVKNGGQVAVQIESTEPYQAWIDAQPAPAQASFEVGLEPGRHTLLLRIEISDRGAPEVRVQVTHPQGSTARVEIVGGM
jgi:putative heme-binding domain-containing protein